MHNISPNIWVICWDNLYLFENCMEHNPLVLSKETLVISANLQKAFQGSVNEG